MPIFWDLVFEVEDKRNIYVNCETNCRSAGSYRVMDNPAAFSSATEFESLLVLIRSRLRPALVSKWGIEVGSDISSDIEEYSWQHSNRLIRMDNPLGYLYRVAQSRSRRYKRWMNQSTFPTKFPDVIHEDQSVHGVLELLAGVTEEQRQCILLIHAFDWTYEEVAELLGVSRSVVNNHVHRGLSRLRQESFSDPLLTKKNSPASQMKELQ
jgi:DNA-directed RNA polymerase specialized sigma24 family protein